MSIEEIIRNKQRSLQPTDNMDSTISEDEKKEQFFQKVRQKIAESNHLHIFSNNNDFHTVRSKIWKIIEVETENNQSVIKLSSYDRAELLDRILFSMFGFGILDPFIRDITVTEIMVNGTDKIYIEQNGVIHLAVDRKGNPIRFRTMDELLHVIEKIVTPINRKVNESDPIVDARLPDGSRVNIVLSPISLDGPALTIRKFPENPFTMDQLVTFGMLTHEIADLLCTYVAERKNIIVSGGTSSGKTTFLNALSMSIPSNSRLITIEDSAELKLSQSENIIRMETRPPNIEGNGEITIRELVRTALRMRPDRIIIGEVRSAEALDMLQALNTGHEGSLSTVHSNSAKDTISRLETMVLMAGFELPMVAIRHQIASAIDVIVHLKKVAGGKRKVTEIIEVKDVNAQGYVEVTPIFTWEDIRTSLEGGDHNEG